MSPTTPQSPIRTAELTRAMNLSYLSGALGTVWVIVCSPQPIFNVFLRNHLGVSATALGLLVGILAFASVFQLLSIVVYSRLSRTKVYWIVTTTIHRLNGFVLAGVAFAIHAGGDRGAGFGIIAGAMIVSWMVTNTSSSGWWSWMADLIPERVRARFFGRRSAISNIINIAWFFAVSVVIDSVAPGRLFLAYGIIFLIGGIGGVVDILVHVFMPQPSRTDPVRPLTAAEFLQPLKDRNFLRFSLTVGLCLFSLNVAAPFISPYITSADGIGAPTTWLGIMFVISQLLWIVLAPAWGTIMDRMGRKPVVMIGLLSTLSWIGYFFVNSGNFMYLLPVIAMVGGVLNPAFWEGINQLMLTLTPQTNRISFVAWYMAIIGLVSAFGSLVGGVLSDRLASVTVVVLGTRLGGFHLVILLALLLVLASIALFSRVTEGSGKPAGQVFSLITNPGIFRAFQNIGILAKPEDSTRVARALRSIDSGVGTIAVDEVLQRLDDPDIDVAEEAARALGRLRATNAAEPLVRHLRDPHSPIRIAAARALGKIGDPAAAAELLEVLRDGSEELQDACLYALGEIGSGPANDELMDIIRRLSSDRLLASGATTAAKLGMIEAAWEIVPQMHATANPLLRRQLAIALANLVAVPGEFYQYVTGSDEQQTVRVDRLFADVGRKLGRLGVPQAARQVGQLKLLYAAGDYAAAMVGMAAIGRPVLAQLVRSQHPEGDTTGSETAATVDDELLVEQAFFLNPRLGVWWWYLQQCAERAGTDPQNPSIPLDVLVALYVVYRVPLTLPL